MNVPAVLHGLMELVVEARRLEERDVERASLAQKLRGLEDLRLLLQQSADDAVEGGQHGACDPNGEHRAKGNR